MNRVLVFLAAVLGALVLAPLGGADAVYHSQHIALTPVGSAPLHSGFVENVHPNGPQVFAHEIYVLNGAAAGSYQVTLWISGDTTACAGASPVPTATLTTNDRGNGVADAVIRPALIDAAGLHGATLGIYWTVVGATASYRTACSVVHLD
jgi:hypothetical protein